MDQASESLEDGEISPDFEEQQQEEEVQQAEQPQQEQQVEQFIPELQVQHDEPQQLQRIQQQDLQQQQLQQQQVEQQQHEQEQHPTAAAAAAEPEEAPSIESRLDFTSAEFDAELALQTDGLQLPVPDAPLLDNISRCAGMLQPADDQQQQQLQQGKGQLEGASSAQEVGLCGTAVFRVAGVLSSSSSTV